MHPSGGLRFEPPDRGGPDAVEGGLTVEDGVGVAVNTGPGTGVAVGPKTGVVLGAGAGDGLGFGLAVGPGGLPEPSLLGISVSLATGVGVAAPAAFVGPAADAGIEGVTAAAVAYFIHAAHRLMSPEGDHIIRAEEI